MRSPDHEPWPGVPEPGKLLNAIADWLGGYGNPATRHTYAEGLGLPTSQADLHDWLDSPQENWRTAVARYAATLGTDPRTASTRTHGDTRTGSDGSAHSDTRGGNDSGGPHAGSDTGDTRADSRGNNRSASGDHAGAGTSDTDSGTGAGSHGDTRSHRGGARAGAGAGIGGTISGAGTGSGTGSDTHSDTRSRRGGTRAGASTGAGGEAGLAGNTGTASNTGTRSGAATGATEPKRRVPPPAPRGRFRHLHWFRWCATHAIDPRVATAHHVKAWLRRLDEAGAAVATRDRMLATVKALYTHLADAGIADANPAALNRRRLGLATPAGNTSATVVLTPKQVRALHTAAARPRQGASPTDAARATAIVTLFTLGLRVSELCGLDRADLHVTRGRRALRVRGKGGKTRVVYLHDAAEQALAGYLAGTTTLPERRERRRGAPSRPLLVTRTGNRLTRQAVWQLLRRLAAATGDTGLAGVLHPHALRHFYVTTAVEAGAQLVHVQADVGHTSVDTTEQVYNSAARDPARSAVDLVAAALAAEPAAEPEIERETSASPLRINGDHG